MKPLVTVITPTTGNPFLYSAIASIDKQTYKNIQHLVVIDGKEREPKAKYLLEGAQAEIITLPYPTGIDNYNGHKIYAAMSFIAKGDYVCFLDEDNWYEPTHIESMVEAMKNKQWAFSLRKIVGQDGKFICNDDCESLGVWPSILNDRFVDVGCFMMKRENAIAFAPGWHRRARNPNEQPEVDRLLTSYLLQSYGENAVGSNGDYTLNYRVASRSDSVQDSFFIKGNEMMKQRMNGATPWRKKI